MMMGARAREENGGRSDLIFHPSNSPLTDNR